MSDQDDRTQEWPRPQEGAGSPDPAPSPEDSGSVLSGYSWDDPSRSSGPTSPDPTSSGDASRAGSSAASPEGGTPAAYPPAAPYPPASATPPAAARTYGQEPGQPGAPDQGWSGQQQPYGQPPYAQQQPYGQQQAYGQGYGSSASYTSTPQPYSYGPPPLSPDAEKVRSSAVLWTVLNGVAIFLCGNLLSIAGVILAALAIGKTRDDVEGARKYVRWSWILFAVGFAFWLLIIIAYIVFLVVVGTAGMAYEF